MSTWKLRLGPYLEIGSSRMSLVKDLEMRSYWIGVTGVLIRRGHRDTQKKAV